MQHTKLSKNQPSRERSSAGKRLSCSSDPGAHVQPSCILGSQNKILPTYKNHYPSDRNRTPLPPSTRACSHTTPQQKGWRRSPRGWMCGSGGGCWSCRAGIECGKGCTSRGLALFPSTAPLPFKIHKSRKSEQELIGKNKGGFFN